MKVYKLIDESGTYFIAEQLDVLMAEIENANPDEGEVITWKIETFHMSEDEYNALPEFDGF